jgi:hypothetical protein
MKLAAASWSLMQRDQISAASGTGRPESQSVTWCPYARVSKSANELEAQRSGNRFTSRGSEPLVAVTKTYTSTRLFKNRVASPLQRPVGYCSYECTLSAENGVGFGALTAVTMNRHCLLGCDAM